MTDIHQQMQDVFRQVFGDPNFILQDDLTAADVDGWDSLAHINLIIAVERRVGIKFATAEISRMKEPGQNVGSLLRLIEKKMGQARGE